MTDLAVLQAEVAALQQRLAALTPPEPALTTPEPAPYTFVPPSTRPLWQIATSPELRGLPVGQVRQLAVAVALCKGDVLHSGAVPSEYEPAMKKLAELRATGMSWRQALGEVGLSVPDDDDLLHQARQLRDELPGLWDAADFLGRLEVALPNWLFGDLKKSLRGFL